MWCIRICKISRTALLCCVMLVHTIMSIVSHGALNQRAI